MCYLECVSPPRQRSQQRHLVPLHALCFCSLPRQPARRQGIGASHPLRRPQTPPLLLEQAFQPKFCACFERLWFWAPMELSSRQDLAHWGENPALHLPVLLAQLRSLPVGFGQRDTLVLSDASSHPSLGRTEAPEPLGCPPGWDSLSPHPLLGGAPVAALLCALLPRHRLRKRLWKQDKIAAGRNHRTALVGKDIILRCQRDWPSAGRARRSAAWQDDR